MRRNSDSPENYEQRASCPHMNLDGSRLPLMRIRKRSYGNPGGMRKVKSFSGRVGKRLVRKANGMV
jgi:hypothetical protein